MAKFFFTPILVSENGVPIKSDNVKIVNTSDQTEIALHYFKAGQYFAEHPIPAAHYDIYIDGYLYGEEYSIYTPGAGGIGYPPDNITITLNGDSELQVEDESINASKIADNSINNQKLQVNCVQEDNIFIASVTNGKLASGAVNNEKIADVAAGKITGQIIETQLSDYIVTEDKLAADSVSATKIVDSNVTREKIQNGAVNNDKVEDVAADKITGQIVNSQVEDYAITEDKLSADSVTEGKIQNGAVTPEKLADGIPKSVDGTTITIDVNGQISGSGGGSGYPPDDTTLDLNGSNEMQIKDSGVTPVKLAPINQPITGATDPNGEIVSVRTGEIIKLPANNSYWIAGNGGSPDHWTRIDNVDTVLINSLESLIYKEGHPKNPNTSNIQIDRLGQTYYSRQNKSVWIAVDSNNPKWRRVRKGV